MKTKLQTMTERLKTLSTKKNIQSTIYTIGLSRNHDASLLNELAQAGSEMGNFIFIDTSVEGYLEQLNGSLGDSLGLALNQSSKPKMTLVNEVTALRDNKVCEVIHDYEETKEAVDPQAEQKAKEPGQISSTVNRNDDEDEEMLDLNMKWTSIKYHTSMIIEKSKILDANLHIELALTKEM
jgi:hypothetical protein